MRKIAQIQATGKAALVVYYDDKASTNPYKVYHEWNELTDHGIIPRKKQINRYADLCSCGWEMYQYARINNEERRA